MFFNKSRFPLPKFPPEIQIVFRQICVELRGEEWQQFLQDASQTLDEKISENNTKQVQQLVNASRELIKRYESLGPKQKALAIGAVRYFIAENDPLSEDVFASGLVDDAKVLNHVLENLEIEGFFVDIE